MARDDAETLLPVRYLPSRIDGRSITKCVTAATGMTSTTAIAIACHAGSEAGIRWMTASRTTVWVRYKLYEIVPRKTTGPLASINVNRLDAIAVQTMPAAPATTHQSKMH